MASSSANPSSQSPNVSSPAATGSGSNVVDEERLRKTPLWRHVKVLEMNGSSGGFGFAAGYQHSVCSVLMSSKKRKTLKPTKSFKDADEVPTSDFIGGEALDDLLSKLVRSVEVAKPSRGGLPEKIWMKQQFAIGINDVTRVLERMSPAPATHTADCSRDAQTVSGLRRAPLVPLQVVLVSSDCNPKWLTKHIPPLASTRQVPVLCLKDNKGSSLRLGQVVNVRTALAIGIKARDNIINKTIDEVLKGSKLVADEP
ncbi:hypothetical protein ACP70R_004822 [Stipagrostis hirtigluma subsp. patula]